MSWTSKNNSKAHLTLVQAGSCPLSAQSDPFYTICSPWYDDAVCVLNGAFPV